MADKINFPDHYRMEVSGWGLDNAFFVEHTDLLCSPAGEKRALLRRALPERAVIVVRLVAQEFATRLGPVPYQVDDVQPMDCNGQCEMRLTRLHPRSKEPYGAEAASYVSEGSLSLSEPRDGSTQMEPQEMLR